MGGEGWAKFSEMKKPYRSAQSWAQNWRSKKDELTRRVETLRAAKAKAKDGAKPGAKAKTKEPPQDSKSAEATRITPTKRKEIAASEDPKPADKASGSHKKPRTSNTGTSAEGSKDGAHKSQSRETFSTIEALMDAAGGSSSGSGSNSKSKSHRPKPQPELKYYLAMVELIVKEGDEPPLSAFIEFCEQEQNKGHQFNQWMKLYRDHRAELIRAAMPLRALMLDQYLFSAVE